MVESLLATYTNCNNHQNDLTPELQKVEAFLPSFQQFKGLEIRLEACTLVTHNFTMLNWFVPMLKNNLLQNLVFIHFKCRTTASRQNE